MAIPGAAGDAGADTHGERLALEVHRLPHRLGQIVGQGRQALPGQGVGQQNHELVAAQAGDHVGGAHLGLQARGHGAQHHVARVVPVAVVDGLEAVQVEQHQRMGQAVGQHARGALRQAGAVGQAGQRVGGGGLG